MQGPQLESLYLNDSSERGALTIVIFIVVTLVLEKDSAYRAIIRNVKMMLFE